MAWVLSVFIIFSVLYAVLMIVYRVGWHLQKTLSEVHYQPATYISVIVPARNEEANIAGCIESILAQNYPSHLLEIIIVDDHSTDATATIAKSYSQHGVKYISLAEHLQGGNTAYKKQALTTGIKYSSGSIIVTTDADCTAPVSWLRLIAMRFEQTNCVMVVAPVDFTSNLSLVEIFQSLDFMSMQGITAATLRLKMGNMCNGANLAFTRAAFDAVDGYKGVDHLATGDDYLLMNKLNKVFPGKIDYLKSEAAIVKTQPQPDWKSFFQQRIRWASKSGKYDDNKLTGILLFVYLYNVSLYVLGVLCIAWQEYRVYMAVLLAAKVLFELIYLYPVATFFSKRRQLLAFLFLQPIHILYIVSAGFLGFFGGYEWKGRSVK